MRLVYQLHRQNGVRMLVERWLKKTIWRPLGYAFQWVALQDKGLVLVMEIAVGRYSNKVMRYTHAWPAGFWELRSAERMRQVFRMLTTVRSRAMSGARTPQSLKGAFDA